MFAQSSEGSDAFKEYVYKRCDEIMQSDSNYIEINSRLIKLEKSILADATTEQSRLLKEYFELVVNLETYIQILFYEQGFVDTRQL